MGDMWSDEGETIRGAAGTIRGSRVGGGGGIDDGAADCGCSGIDDGSADCGCGDLIKGFLALGVREERRAVPIAILARGGLACVGWKQYMKSGECGMHV